MTKNKHKDKINIKVNDAGFYQGFNQFITLSSKLIIAIVVIWIISDPSNAGQLLNDAKMRLYNISMHFIFMPLAFTLWFASLSPYTPDLVGLN